MEYKLHIVEMPSLMEGGKITNVRYSKTVLRLDSSEILHRCGETVLKGWEEGIDLVYLLTCSFQSCLSGQEFAHAERYALGRKSHFRAFN